MVLMFEVFAKVPAPPYINVSEGMTQYGCRLLKALHSIQKQRWLKQQRSLNS